MKILYLILLIHLTKNFRRKGYCPWGNYPVCGVDYVTYLNQCALSVAYVELLHVGECKKIKSSTTGEFISNCSQLYEPVCGRDNVTYLNECRLEMNEIKLAYNSPCNNENFVPYTPPLKCDCLGSSYNPICSLNGTTFENECVLNCTQQIHQNRGPCESPGDCPRKYRPVCGVDGLTYDNKCTLNSVKVLKQGNGECPSILKGCEFCSKVFLPVCGQNSKTYRNLCELKCNKAKFEKFGKCDVVVIKKNNCENCGNNFQPICGTDGNNYDNECLCKCKGNCNKYSDGKCPEATNCSYCQGTNLREVCGVDGISYNNLCYSECAGVPISKHERC